MKYEQIKLLGVGLLQLCLLHLASSCSAQVKGFRFSRAASEILIELRWQEWIPLQLADPGPIHIPSIQERAERLISRFKGKPERPPKVITKHGHFCGLIFIVFFFFYDHLTLSNTPPSPLEPKKKPSRFFIEQWKVSHGLSQSSASPLCSPESPRQV